MKNYLKIIGILIGITLLTYAGAVLIPIIYMIIKNTSDIDSYLKSSNFEFWMIIYMAIYSIIFIYIFKKKYKNKDTNLDKSKIKYLIINGISISIFLNIIINLLTKNNGSDFNILILLVTGILGPILEEYLFRGYVYNKIKSFNKKNSIFITSILFSLMHTGLFNMIYAFIIGYLLIYIYNKFSNIKAPIIMHISINSSIILLNNYLINFNIYLGIVLLICLISFIYTFKKLR